MIKNWFTAERFPSMVGIGFDDAASARAALLTLSQDPGLATARIALVEPGDPQLARKVEPESQGIARTMIRAHLTLGLAGLIFGLVLAFALLAADVPMFTSSPAITIVTVAAFSLIFGLMLGGLVGLRPDHDTVISRARDFSSAGKWFVIVHARDTVQRDRARHLLDSLAEPGDQALQTI